LLEVGKIRELVEMMIANDLVELSLRDGEEEVCLRRPNPGGSSVHASPSSAAPPLHAVSATPTIPDGFLEEEGGGVEFQEIRSPMVGTFYASPDPESSPFVQVGSQVGPSTVVCILEAMKVFSEIKAETSGTVEQILVTDGQAVEYGQALFLVRSG
jgi:acetyl-CoA carboxylase biotin carboxyl carrier protein